MEITEEQIKEAHNVACSQWKQKIEQWFPECFKPKYEIGKWYKFIGGNSIVCYQGDGNAYGMGAKTWDDNLTMHTDNWTPATTEEVESMLLKESKKKGYKKGIEVYSIKDNTKWTLNGDFRLTKNGDLTDTSTYLMKDGKWATIVETPTEMTLEEIEKQLGHKVKITTK